MVCAVENKSKDIGMGIRKSIQCGVIPTLFGCFSSEWPVSEIIT